MIRLLPWNIYYKINVDVHIIDKQTPLDLTYDYGNIEAMELLVPQIMIKTMLEIKKLLLVNILTIWSTFTCTIKMGQAQLLCCFQRGKDLKLEIEMTSNHCTKCMV
jgi:hypothetical protein